MYASVDMIAALNWTDSYQTRHRLSFGDKNIIEYKPLLLLFPKCFGGLVSFIGVLDAYKTLICVLRYIVNYWKPSILASTICCEATQSCSS